MWVFGSGRDRVAPLGLVAVRGGETDVNVLSGVMARPGWGIEDDALGARRLIDQPGLRRALGHAGQEKLLRLYPPERELDDYLALYQRLAGAHQT